MQNVKANIKLKKDTKVALDCGYSDGINIKFAEDRGIDLYVPSRSQAQEIEGKEQTLNHDNYEYDWKKDEIIVGKDRFRYSGMYERNGVKKVFTYYCQKLHKKKGICLASSGER